MSREKPTSLEHPNRHYKPKDKSDMLSIPCKVCGKIIRTWQKNTRFCGKDCRKAATLKPAVADPCISRGTRGAVGELSVTVDLLRRNYEVFRNVSQHGSCDLIAMKVGRIIRVEVKSSTINTETGKVYIPLHLDASKFDLLAIYSAAGVLYQPELPE